jgi:hypothetical protein
MIPFITELSCHTFGSISLRLQGAQQVPVEHHQFGFCQCGVGIRLLSGMNNFEKFLEMLDGAQTGAW